MGQEQMASSQLNDTVISRAIIERFSSKLTRYLNNDVVIVGGGPAGMVAGYFLARSGYKVALFERKLSVGGGMWGGGMMFNEIVVQEEAADILRGFNIPLERYEENYYTADSVTAVSTICSQATLAGLQIFNLIEVEDLMIKENQVKGLVVNWSSVSLSGLHVDPISVGAQYVIDATGHPCEICHLLEEKSRIKLETENGGVMGERSMWADTGERHMHKNTRMVYPDVYVAGMAANAVFGSPRMGPVFGGMLISGKKVAQLIKDKDQ